MTHFSTSASTGQITALKDGNFLAVWTEVSPSRASSVYGQIFRADGSIVRSKFAVATVENTDFSDITAEALADGRTLIAWSRRDGDDRLIEGKVLDAHHNLQPATLSLGNPDGTGETSPQIHVMDNGGFTILYNANFASTPSEIAYVCSTVATPVAGGGWTYENFYAHPWVNDPTAPTAVLSNGNFVLLNAASADGANTTLSVHIWPQAEDAPAGLVVDQVPGMSIVHANVTPLSGGTFAAVWEDVSDATGAHFIHAQVFDANGAPIGSAMNFTKPNGALTGKPVIEKLSNGGFAVVFSIEDAAGDENVYVATCNANGVVVKDSTVVGSSTAGDQWNAHVIALANGSYAVSWLDAGAGYKLMTQVFSQSGAPVEPVESPPSDIHLSKSSVDEGSGIEVVVGNLSAVDETGGAVSYSIQRSDGTWGNTSSDGRFKIVGNQLVANGSLLDYELVKTYGLVIRATDTAQLSFAKNFIITVNDKVGERITGSSGNDRLYADVGNDLLKGGNGNDTVVSGIGNDTLYGGNGNDLLHGGQGNDILYGDLGKDYFVFDSVPNARSNVDTIKDFSVKDDTIRLENAVFRKLGSKTGTLNKAFFTIGTKAKDKNDYLVYNDKTGALSYDADGSGKLGAVKIAQLSKNLTKLTYADFAVI